jgi:hypothetical protein
MQKRAAQGRLDLAESRVSVSVPWAHSTGSVSRVAKRVYLGMPTIFALSTRPGHGSGCICRCARGSTRSSLLLLRLVRVSGLFHLSTGFIALNDIVDHGSFAGFGTESTIAGLTSRLGNGTLELLRRVSTTITKLETQWLILTLRWPSLTRR